MKIMPPRPPHFGQSQFEGMQHIYAEHPFALLAMQPNPEPVPMPRVGLLSWIGQKRKAVLASIASIPARIADNFRAVKARVQQSHLPF